MAGELMSWNDLVGKPVLVAGQGRQAGVVEDFYYDPETQSIYALRVQSRLRGSRVLLKSAIADIDPAGVTIANENMLIDETNAGHIYRLPLGHQLVGFRVLDQKGHELGTIGNLLLGISPLVAMRISSFELDRPRGRRISAHAITHIGEDTLTIMD